MSIDAPHRAVCALERRHFATFRAMVHCENYLAMRHELTNHLMLKVMRYQCRQHELLPDSVKPSGGGTALIAAEAEE
jgi:hypothetical protein